MRGNSPASSRDVEGRRSVSAAAEQVNAGVRLRISRRTLLLAAAAGLAPRLPALAATASPMFFSADERRCVEAFVDRLIPSDETGPGAVESGVAEFIDRQMQLPYGFGKLWFMGGPFVAAPATLGHQLPLSPRDIYRDGIAALNATTTKTDGKVFADLPHERQETLIHQIEAGTLALGAVPGAVFFGQIWTNTKEGYFADPIHGGNRGMGAWKMIGFPGARADFTDWVDRYAARYPFGPVSITDIAGTAPARIPGLPSED